MSPHITEPLHIGKETIIESFPNETSNAVIFEDDGVAGYFYAIELLNDYEIKVHDAVHIYNVEKITNKDIPSEVKIYWTNDSTKAALYIDNDCHAIMDFKNKRGLCRTGFPPATQGWANEERVLTEENINEIFNN